MIMGKTISIHWLHNEKHITKGLRMNMHRQFFLIAAIVSVIFLPACSISPPTEIPIVETYQIQEKELDALFSAYLSTVEIPQIITPTELRPLIDEEPPPFLLDVRSFKEGQEQGYIKGSVVIPLSELAKRAQLLPSYDATIVAYCSSGRRCTIAMVLLRVLGWRNVFTLTEGSFAGWQAAGHLVVQGFPKAQILDAAHPDPSLLAHIDRVLSKAPDEWGFITPERLHDELNTNSNLVLIDVRSDVEIALGGATQGALQIPLEEFISRKSDWPEEKNRTIIIYSGDSLRSIIAMTILWCYGYQNVFSI